MPDVYAKHLASVKAVQAYLGPKCPVFTWAGNTYQMLPGSVMQRKDLGVGGFKLSSDLRFLVCSDAFPNPPPQLKQMLTYLGINFRIDSIRTLPGGILQEFECNDPNQPA